MCTCFDYNNNDFFYKLPSSYFLFTRFITDRCILYIIFYYYYSLGACPAWHLNKCHILYCTVVVYYNKVLDTHLYYRLIHFDILTPLNLMAVRPYSTKILIPKLKLIISWLARLRSSGSGSSYTENNTQLQIIHINYMCTSISQIRNTFEFFLIPCT